jgi:hypothetical protein
LIKKSAYNRSNYAFGGRVNYQLSRDLNIGSSFVAAQIDVQNGVDWQHTLGMALRGKDRRSN